MAVDVTLDGDRYFYLKLEPGANNEKLYMRGVAAGSPEKLLVDPSALVKSPQEHYTINYFVPSLDGRYVAYGISEGGSENAVIHVIESATGNVLPDAIDRCKFVGVTSWLPDNSFYYVRFPKPAPNADPTTSELKSVAYLHVLGRNPDSDPAIFGYGVNPDVKFAPIDFPIVARTPASPYVIGLVAHGVQNEGTLYVAAADAVTTPSTPWKKLLDVDSAVTLLLVVLTPVETEAMPVDAEVDSDVTLLTPVLRPVEAEVDRAVTLLFVVLTPVDTEAMPLVAVLRPVDADVERDVTSDDSSVDSDVTLLTPVLRPVEADVDDKQGSQGEGDNADGGKGVA